MNVLERKKLKSRSFRVSQLQSFLEDVEELTFLIMMNKKDLEQKHMPLNLQNN